MVAGARYFLTHGARTVCAVASQPDLIQFYVGTASVTEENILYVLEVSPAVGGNAVKEKAKHVHADEIYSMSSLEDSELGLVATCGSGNVHVLEVSESELKEQSSVSIPGKSKSVDWCASDKILACSTKSVQLVDLGDGRASTAEVLQGSGLAKAKADSRKDTSRFAAADVETVSVMDLRSNPKEPAATLAVTRALDVDFNPNRRNLVATGDEQGQVDIWDLRRTETPLIRYYGHSHWARSVRFNPLHDDLLLSGGTDGVVHLWREDSEEERDETANVFESVCAYPEHDDCVNEVSWSSADEFAFASISYDGRFNANFVPRQLKNEILLS